MTQACGLNKKKILITAGPTWVAIDDMRIITNGSSGQMGHLLAKECQRAGAEVTLIEGPVLRPLDNRKIRSLKFNFYDELKTLLDKELKKHYDVIIHAAAVSDYKIERPSKTKIPSGQKSMSLTLVPTEKLIDRIRTKAAKSVLVGFKLKSFRCQ